MAIINSYKRDPAIKDNDVFIGTKYTNKQTVNYTAQSIADYLNINGKISISGQMSWKFVTSNKGIGTISFVNEGGDNTPFSNITELILSTKDASTQDVTIFLNYLVDSYILLSKQNEINEFGHYKITSYQVTANPEFYKLTVVFVGGNGNIIKDSYYDMVSFLLASNTDKSYIFTQAVPSTVWIINHGLNKFPSVSVVNNNNILMYGEVSYIDANNLQVNFSAGFSGKAYIN
jgi:hypothetical protein